MLEEQTSNWKTSLSIEDVLLSRTEKTLEMLASNIVLIYMSQIYWLLLPVTEVG